MLRQDPPPDTLDELRLRREFVTVVVAPGSPTGSKRDRNFLRRFGFTGSGTVSPQDNIIHINKVFQVLI